MKLNSQTFAKQQKEIRLNESKQFNKLVQIDIEWRAEREREGEMKRVQSGGDTFVDTMLKH